MALRRALSKRLFTKTPTPISSPPPDLENSGLIKTNFQREFLSPPEESSTNAGFFRQFLEQRREINQSVPTKLPEFLSIPVGDKLREKLRSMNIAGERPHLVSPSLSPVSGTEIGGISVLELRKIWRSSQLEKVRLKLREIPSNSISYYEFVKICGDFCENLEQCLEFSKILDHSGAVIILGNVVFLRPDQITKSVEKMISESIAKPNDPRKKELEEMEKKKAIIDEKAESVVKAELYCGLGFLMVQTLGFMRLTFWELSWDVMEPICFFVTSFHFAIAYGFFLRTSKEPTFEGYFQRRFRVKQKKLMKIHNFDAEKYSRLRQAFYLEFSCDLARGPMFGPIHG